MSRLALALACVVVLLAQRSAHAQAKNDILELGLTVGLAASDGSSDCACSGIADLPSAALFLGYRQGRVSGGGELAVTTLGSERVYSLAFGVRGHLSPWMLQVAAGASTVRLHGNSDESKEDAYALGGLASATLGLDVIRRAELTVHPYAQVRHDVILGAFALAHINSALFGVGVSF